MALAGNTVYVPGLWTMALAGNTVYVKKHAFCAMKECKEYAAKKPAGRLNPVLKNYGIN